MKQNELLISFYGDDFAGSVETLEILSKAGLRTVLFIQPPEPEQLDRYSGLRAAGIAGHTRTLPPERVDEVLRPALSSLRRLRARHVHYRAGFPLHDIPPHGSIGKAVEAGAELFPGPFVPVLPAAPALGSYCVFGHLFTRNGDGAGTVAPAAESDLRLHLLRQTSIKAGLLDVLQLPHTGADAALEGFIREGAGLVLLDVLSEDQMAAAGALMDDWAERGRPLFSVGSSGVALALAAHWKEQGGVLPTQEWPVAAGAGPLLVLSGSCTAVTAGQIAWAVDNGFAEVPVEIKEVGGKEGAGFSLGCDMDAVVSLLKEGQSVVVHTSRGADDDRIARTAKIFEQQEMDTISPALAYGSFLGNLAREVAPRTGLKRVVVAGGDTCGYAARAMGIESVEMAATLYPGSPLCRAFAPGSPVNGLEVAFKGGEAGGEDYFGKVRGGG